MSLDGVKIASVDCTEHEDIAKRFGIAGFPTLKLIKGKNYWDYLGSRTNVTELAAFAIGGYKDTPPFVLPEPPTLLERLPEMILGPALLDVRSDFVAYFCVPFSTSPSL